MTGFKFEDKVSQRLLIRWRKLSHLAIGLSMLLLALVLVGLGLLDTRQQLSKQLQLVLQESGSDYFNNAVLVGQQLNLWQRKQTALAQWASAEQLSQMPFHALLLAQQLASAANGRVKKLAWDGQQIQIMIHSAATWPVVQKGLRVLPWVSLESVRQINSDKTDVGWYEYQVVIAYGGIGR